jgi:hypothetical protein
MKHLLLTAVLLALAIPASAEKCRIVWKTDLTPEPVRGSWSSCNEAMIFGLEMSQIDVISRVELETSTHLRIRVPKFPAKKPTPEAYHPCIAPTPEPEPEIVYPVTICIQCDPNDTDRRHCCNPAFTITEAEP